MLFLCKLKILIQEQLDKIYQIREHLVTLVPEKFRNYTTSIWLTETLFDAAVRRVLTIHIHQTVFY